MDSGRMGLKLSGVQVRATESTKQVLFLTLRTFLVASGSILLSI